MTQRRVPRFDKETPVVIGSATMAGRRSKKAARRPDKALRDRSIIVHEDAVQATNLIPTDRVGTAAEDFADASQRVQAARHAARDLDGTSASSAPPVPGLHAAEPIDMSTTLSGRLEIGGFGC
jgi:hypothetical protein